jgi:hypothetical protein
MSKVSLDLSQFKHVKSDDRTTTLKHRDGHILTIANKALKPEHQQQLSALSGVSKQSQTPDQSMEARAQMAGGGDAKDHKPESMLDYKPYAKGGMSRSDIDKNMQSPHPEKQYDSKMPDAKMPFAAEGGKVKESKPEPPKKPENTLNYNDIRQRKREMNVEEARKPIMPKMADGGSPPTVLAGQSDPGPAPKVDLTTSEKARKASSGADNGGSIPSLDEAINRLKNAWACGGKISMAGGGRVMMVEGGDPADQEPVDMSQFNAPDYSDPSNVPVATQTPDQETYNSAYKQGLSNYDTMSGNNQPGRAGVASLLDPQDKEVYAADQGINAVKLRQEDKEQQDLAKDAKALQINKLNTQLSKIGAPPIPGTVSPNLQDIESNSVPQAQGFAPQDNQDQDDDSDQSQPKPGQPGLMDQQGLLQSGLEQERAGQQNYAAAVGKQGEAQAAALDQHVKDSQTAQMAYKTSFDVLNQERLNHIQDIQNGYINPDAYWDNHSKVAAGIGMILAGFNPTNSPNAATNFLKYQIDNSINAQAKNLEAKGNLLAANLHQFGNLKDAADQTRLMMADQLTAQLNSAAAKAAGPMAQANAQKAIGEINRTYAPLGMQLSMRQALMGLAGGGGSSGSVEQLMNYMDASGGNSKPYRERYVPGFVGINGGSFASSPVPDSFKNELASYQNVGRLMNEARALSNKPWTSLSVEERAKGQALMGELQGAIRQAEGQGVYKESEAKFMKGILGTNPAGALAKFSTEPKLQELQKIKQAEAAGKAAVYGLKLQQAPQQEIRVKNGKRYMRGPGGVAVPVD